MKKFSITMLSIICCAQNMQGMEIDLSQCMQKMEVGTPSKDDGYEVVYKDLSEYPETRISTKYNEFSEKLYADNITDDKIRELKKEGAEFNYKRLQYNSDPVIFSFAFDSSSQGIKNMRAMIEGGASLHHFPETGHIPLTIALQRDHIYTFHDKDFSEMIQLLIPYETPIVTIYEGTVSPDTTRIDDREQRIREYLISQSFLYPNITTIKMLLDLKLVTANRGLKEFAQNMTPNQVLLDLLLAYSPTNANELLPAIMDKAFPNTKNDTFASTQYISFLLQMCASKASNKEVLDKMLSIQNDIKKIIDYLEQNK